MNWRGEGSIMSDRAVKSISFKLSDPFERQLLEHTEQFSNFSTYIKRLIQRDKEGIHVPQSVHFSPVEEQHDEDAEAMEGYF